MKGQILAMDLGTKTGWALGPAGACPRSGTVVLKHPDEPRDVCFSNMIFWLNDTLGRQPKPALIVKEAPFHLGAFAKRGNSEAAVLLTYGLHAVVEGIAHRWEVPCRSVADGTVRKHFLGKGRIGDRAATKAAVLDRCRLLRLIPKDCKDEDRADALAVHDWAAATLGGKRDRELYLYNEVVR